MATRLSPLKMLLGAIFFVSANVFAAGAVLGVDLGTEYIKAALVKPGIPLEIVLTKDSRRKETSAVAFKPPPGTPKIGQFPERSYGADAMAVAARFPGEVYPNLKTLLGLPTDHVAVKEFAAHHPALQLQSHASRGTAAFKSKALAADEDTWMVEELLAMELQSVQRNAEAAAGDGSSVRSIVLTVPPFYTLEEKRAVQLAAELAGLKVLSLVSDGLAVGLNYATSRQFPNINSGEKPEYHLVFDMGAGSSSATVLRFQSRTLKDVGKFNKTVQEVQALGGGWDRTLGGDALNYLIVDNMISQFIESKGAQKISATTQGVRAHGRAMAKMLKEAERLRHVLSANTNTQAAFEGLYEDVDFKYKITRAEFEAMAEAHAERIATVIGDAIKMSGLELSDLTTIILHGGATRTPFVQKAIEKAVGTADKIRSNVNADEAAVFGAGFRAAELSPSFRVKEIRIAEGPMYASGLKRAKSGKPQRQRLWTPVSPLGGVPKELTYNDQQDFALAFYQQVGSEDRDVATLATKNLTATVSAMKEKYPSCVPSDIVFKLGVRLSAENGEVQVVRAAVECEAEVTVKERFVDGVKNLFGFGGKKDQKPLNGEGEQADAEKPADLKESTKEEVESSSTASAAPDSSSSSSPSSSASASKASSETTASSSAKSAAPSEVFKEVKKKQIVSIPVDITLEKAGLPELSKTELTKIKNRLGAFAASDKARLQREEILNQLEGYTYKVRDLLEAESFVAASADKERATLAEKASEIRDWLYEDGAEATKDILKSKLKVLQDIVVPIQTRVDETEKRPGKIASLKEVLKSTGEYVDGIHKQIADYEKWQAKESTSSASASTSATSTTSASAEKPTGEFDGLEDEDEGKQAKADAPQRKKGPLPPVFTKEDILELGNLRKVTEEWLKEMESKQAKLAPTASPVLLVKDIAEKIRKLDKLSLDLALRGARDFGGKNKKAGKAKSKKGGAAEDPIKGGRLTPEQLEELLAKVKSMDDEKKPGKDGEKKDEKRGHDEL